jgi:hypothetical protein
LTTVAPSPGEISVGVLSKEEAARMGIVMKQRPNGDAGVMVWIEFQKKGVLESFTYAELEMRDPAGKHLASARLQPHPVVHGQPSQIVSVAFSADPSELEKCAFLVVAYGSTRGDVGYVLKVKDFLSPTPPAK